MRIKVEACWAGNATYYFRLTLPCGARERLRWERWTRALAREALDKLEALWRPAVIRSFHP